MMKKKIYEMIKVTVPFDKVGEFNEYWAREALPIWLRHDVKHIGSFLNFVGEPTNEIIRLFEFKSIAHWEEWEEFTAGDSEEARNLFKGISKYILTVEKRLLLSAF
jgi:hypothetical protein